MQGQSGNKKNNITEQVSAIKSNPNIPNDIGQEITDIAASVPKIAGEAAAIASNVSIGNLPGAALAAVGIATDVAEIFPKIKDVVSHAGNDLKEAGPEVKKLGSDILSFITDTVSVLVNDVGHILGDVVNGKFGEIPEDLAKTVNDTREKVTSGIESITNNVKVLENSHIIKDVEALTPGIGDKAKEIFSKITTTTLNEGDKNRSSQQQQDHNKSKVTEI